MLRIHVLGELAVESSEGPIELAGSGRGRSLLAWLALNPGTHPRSRLAPRFWPDVLDSSARASLRNALWALRRSLGDEDAEALVATRDRAGLAGPPTVWVDATAFHEHLAAGRLDEALELGRGELLAGLEEDWVLEYRDAHRERLSELFERMAARAESEADPAGAVVWARRRVALDPLGEPAQRALIARLTAAGDRGGALAAYDRLRERLRGDLGLSPSAETRALVAELREDVTASEPAPAPHPASVASSPPPAGLPDRLAQAAASPWVGRQEQLTRVRIQLDRVLRGETGLLLLTGEGGIGKTRLLAELASDTQGAAVLYGRCDEDELFPFGPWIQALGGHLARIPDVELEPLLGESGPALARLLPELRDRLPQLGDVPASDPETERARLFAAVVAVLARLAERHPLVAIVDDLHWADRSSLLLGRHIVRATGLGRVFMVGTYRDTELSDEHPLREVLADLERDGPIERVHLAGLDEREVAELIDATGEGLPDATVRAVADETQGNPFFVKQLVRHLEEEGTGSGGDGFGLPAGLRDVITRRVARLPGAASAVLRFAALIGRDFDLSVLERVAGLPEDDLLDALDAAVRGGILVEVGDAPGRYSFVHALLRTTLEQELTATRRARLHRRIGEAIEAVYPDRLDDHLDDLARHFAAAGPREVDRAVVYAERAAEQATARLAYEEALRLLADAVEARDRQPSPAPLERPRLLLALAAARSRAGHPGAARETYAEAADAARAAGAAELFARAALGHPGGLWDNYGNADPASAGLFREALEMLPDEDSPLRAQVLAGLIGVLYFSPEGEETAERLAREATGMARRLDDAEALTAALFAAVWAYWRPGRAEARLEVIEELLAVARRRGDLEAVTLAHAWQHGVLLELCRRDEADAARAAHAQLAERLRLPELTLQAAAFRAAHALLDGRWDDAESAMRDVVAEDDPAPTLVARSFLGGQAMALLSEQLRLGEALVHFEPLAQEITGFPGWRTLVAWAHAQAGRPDLALAELDDLRRAGRVILPRDTNYNPTLVILSEIAAELSDAALAAEVEPLLRPLADVWSVMGVGAAMVGPVATALGRCALLQGRHDAAATDFARALELSRRMRSRPHEAHALLGLSKALRDGDATRADELRDEAVAIGQALGMKRLLRDADAAPRSVRAI